jgi:hypothetical protein
MAFTFITQADLETVALEKILTERSEENIPAILEALELQNISLIRSKLQGRYDIDAIFAATGFARHYLIVKILSKLIVFDYVRRNAYRKVPEDYARERDWAMSQLEKLASGTMVADGLPVPAEGGNLIKGNITNSDWMI